MKQTNWYWDLRISPEAIREILTNDQSPRFASVAARLLARSDDPQEVFSWISPTAFCRRFYAIQRQIAEDKWAWTKERAALWQATYQRYLRQFRKEGVRIRERVPRNLDAFSQELLEKVRSCREQAHLSQQELAERLGYSQQFISGIESGREKITLDFLRKFAKATGSRFDVILWSADEGSVERKVMEEDYAGLKQWVEEERLRSLNQLGDSPSGRGLMEVLAYCPDHVVNARRNQWHEVAEIEGGEKLIRFRQDQLRKAMEETQVHAFGWPIGVVLDRPEYEPKPVHDGIRADILLPDKSQYDGWVLRNDSVFYLLQTLFEDTRSHRKIFFDTRIVRTAETILRLARLYKALVVAPNTKVLIQIRYMGLRGRTLSVADRRRVLHGERICIEDEIMTSIQEQLGNMESKLVELTHRAVSELTMLFDYFQPSKEQVVQPLLQGFFKGEWK